MPTPSGILPTSPRIENEMLSAVKNTLGLLPGFETAYRAYLFAFRHDYWDELQSMHKFYAGLIRPDDLIFDVGANVGAFAETFLALGARVVAVEPVPSCIEALGRIRSKRLQVIPCALGSTSGETTLHINPKRPTLSTVSDSWLAIAKRAERFKTEEWSQTMVVPVTTLDNLIAQYGVPAYIKVDVEGFEQEVLAGLTSLSSMLSFEYNCEAVGATIKCLSLPVFANAQFNFRPAGHVTSFAVRWTKNREELIEGLRHYESGDVFVQHGT